MVRRVRQWGRDLAWLVPICLGTMGASGGTGTEPPLATAGLEPELETVVSELVAAGNPPTREELIELEAAMNPREGTWRLAWREQWQDAAGRGRSGDLRRTAPRQIWRLRWRTTPLGPEMVGGGVVAGVGRWELACGRLGLRQGYGLLMAGPGRQASLSADAPLTLPRGRLQLWSGGEAARVITGGAVAYQNSKWRLRILAGRPSGSTQPAEVWLFRWTWKPASESLALLGLKTPTERGLSLALRSQAGPVGLAGEAAWHKHQDSEVAGGRVMGHLTWQPSRTWTLLLLAGWSAPGPRPGWGQKHPVWAGWSGAGQGVRVIWRPGPGNVLRVLYQAGRGHDAGEVAGRLNRQLADVQWARRLTAGWRLTGRWRRATDRVLAWSERFPWLPGESARLTVKSTFDLGLRWEDPLLRWDLRWRRLMQDRTDWGSESGESSGGERTASLLGGERALLTLGLRWKPAPGVVARGAWSTSWGDDVDLVSASVPLAGLITARHWGRWSGEKLVGVEVGRGQWQVGAAVARREAAPASREWQADIWQLWLEVKRQW